MESPQSWYIIKLSTQKCEIVSRKLTTGDDRTIIGKWGPFDSKEDAIACRVGLIRTGKCEPV